MPEQMSNSSMTVVVIDKQPERSVVMSDDDLQPNRTLLQTNPTTIGNLIRALPFRFAFVYIILLLFPFPINLIPIDRLTGWWDDALHTVVQWIGKQVFDIVITVFTNGSGDTTYDYLRTLCFIVGALLAALAWSLLDRRTDFSRLNVWLRVYVRFWLGTIMISYGAAKVIKTQFPDPSLERLIQSFGDASPMGLLWTFMGASTGYTVFTGAVEMVGGLLLFVRRTTLFGAIVCAGAMVNIFALNLFYDVPVKIFSFHLLAMAVLLMLPDLKRLGNFLVLNRAVEPAPIVPLFRSVWLHRSSLAIAALFAFYTVGYSLYENAQMKARFFDAAQQSPLRGIWSVDELKVDSVERPPLVTDESRWRRVVFDYQRTVVVQLMSDARQRYRLELDAEGKRLTMTKRDDPDWKAVLTYDRTAPDELILDGTLEGRKIHATLHKADESRFQLTSRGFHWINEFPYNQ
jgi:hypothetical protein